MYSFTNYLTILFLLINLKQYEAKYADECRTPTYTIGQCVPIHSCLIILHRLSRSGENVPEDYAQRKPCGVFNNVLHVCCAKENITLNFQGLEILNKSECGEFQIPRDREVEARLSTFPWMALLRYDDDKLPFKCGASLISHRYILTAAHCIRNIKHRLTEVRLGEHDIRSDPDCEKFGRKTVCAPPVENVGVEEIIVHPDYDDIRIHNDIALIRLDRSVSFKYHIRPICLPISKDLRTKSPQDYFLSSWAGIEIGSNSNVLKHVVIPHKKLDVCLYIYFRANLSTNHICAGGENKQGSCYGDSGSPLSAVDLYNGYQRMVQYGISSFGNKPCFVNGIPDIYTNVAKYMQWITDTIRND